MTDQAISPGKAISPLRRRMIEDMTIRKLAPKTQHDYVQRVNDFAAFLGRSPDAAQSEDVRRFRLHLTSSGAGTPKINATVSALRFFFKVTLDRPDLTKHLAFMHEPRKVPVVLSPEEVARFLEAAPGVKYKAALSVAYGAGLRVSEVVSLKVSDVDSKRMMLRVEQGKSLPPRRRGAARIATRCFPRCCSNFCAIGIVLGSRRAGCSRVRTRSPRWGGGEGVARRARG
jgi:integrase/recombinase XerD